MSTPAQIITDVKRLNQTTTSQYPDADAYRDLNKVKDEFFNKLVNEGISGYYNWEEWTTDTVALQTEYRLDIPTSTNPGTKTINSIYVNYDGETYTNTGLLKYTPATLVDPKNLKEEWGFYCENQSTSSPIYFQKDNSVFIAPVPLSSTAGTNRLQIEGIRKIADYDENTTELETKLPVEFHYILEAGLTPFCLMSKGMDAATVNNAKATYRVESAEAIKQLTNRIEQPFFNSYPEEKSNDNNISFTTA